MFELASVPKGKMRIKGMPPDGPLRAARSKNAQRLHQSDAFAGSKSCLGNPIGADRWSGHLAEAAGTAIADVLTAEAGAVVPARCTAEVAHDDLDKLRSDVACCPGLAAFRISSSHFSVDDGLENARRGRRDPCRGSNTSANDAAICARTKRTLAAKSIVTAH